jgi:hypothetical protein
MADGSVLAVGDPWLFASIVRSLTVRFVAGSMMLSGAFSALSGLVAPTTDGQFSCALAAAVCFVACYHYMAIVGVRAPRDKPATAAQQIFNEGLVDSIRHSDWLATLGALVIDLHVIAGGHTKFFAVGWSVFALVLMVALGGFVRFGCDELAPSRANDWAVRALGVLAFLCAWVCLVLVLCNLLIDLESEDRDYLYAFSLPWVAYGCIAVAAIVTRQFLPTGYPLALSVIKDVLYGVLDVWSKSSFALWVGAKALGKADAVFGF